MESVQAGLGHAGVRFFCLVLILWTVACFPSEQSQAKVAAGVSGIVTDASGAVVSGATIQMKSSETGIVDDPANEFRWILCLREPAAGTLRHGGKPDRLHHISPNRHSARRGFRQSPEHQVERWPGQRESGGLRRGVQLDTASTQMGEVISERTITAVPLVTRSYTDLLALQPGVTPTSSGLAGGQGGQFSATGFTFTNVSGDLNAGNLSVNGQRESSNGFLLNGTTVQEFAFSGAAIIPNLDSIAEFRIVTNNFDAEYGNYAGGQINVITKSGANRFHGSVFEFLRNTAFDATNYFSSKKDDHKQNEFGGTIGGPIKRRISCSFSPTIREIAWSSVRVAGRV